MITQQRHGLDLHIFNEIYEESDNESIAFELEKNICVLMPQFGLQKYENHGNEQIYMQRIVHIFVFHYRLIAINMFFQLNVSTSR